MTSIANHNRSNISKFFLEFHPTSLHSRILGVQTPIFISDSVKDTMWMEGLHLRSPQTWRGRCLPSSGFGAAMPTRSVDSDTVVFLVFLNISHIINIYIYIYH